MIRYFARTAPRTLATASGSKTSAVPANATEPRFGRPRTLLA